MAATSVSGLRASAQTQAANTAPRVSFDSIPTSSSSRATFDDEVESSVVTRLAEEPQPQGLYSKSVRPFSAIAVQLKAGSYGAGFDIATPLMQRMNLRGGASFLPLNTGFDADGLHIEGAIQFQNASLMLDIFPFNNSFRISPGIAVYNDTHLNAHVYVPGGQPFSLGEDGDYTSDPDDPVTGRAFIKMGGRIAPRLTIGTGNMIPRGGGHWSMPFEIGFQYNSTPTMSLQLGGSVCTNYTDPSDGSTGVACGPIDQSQVASQQAEFQSDLNSFKFYPILSLGLSYRFGHGSK